MTIQGRGAGQTTINGQNSSRLFNISNTAGTVTFDGLTLIGGKTTADSGRGGAIRSVSSGRLTVQDSIISGNSTSGEEADGGGIYAGGLMSIINSTISGNFTAGGIRFRRRHIALWFNRGHRQHYLRQIHVRIRFRWRRHLCRRRTLSVANSTISGNPTRGEDPDGGGIAVAFRATSKQHCHGQLGCGLRRQRGRRVAFSMDR